jgi:hypothetical protein
VTAGSPEFVCAAGQVQEVVEKQHNSDTAAAAESYWGRTGAAAVAVAGHTQDGHIALVMFASGEVEVGV